MLDSYNSALAEGTVKNRRSQVQLYIKFMLLYGFNYMSLTPTHLGVYYQFLGNYFAAPGTVKNHISGVKSWLLLHNGSTQGFDSPTLPLVIKSNTEKSGHIPAPAPPITAKDIRTICLYIDQNPQHPAIKSAILLAYATFMRVSNVLSPSINSAGGRHTLKVNDVIHTQQGLQVVIRSTKTRRHGVPHIIQVFTSTDPIVCPVRAWNRYLTAIQPCPIGPAFMLDPSTPLTSPPVVGVMRKALASTSTSKTRPVSFHSLRRGGAQSAAASGASLQQLMYHGTWTSKNGLRAYIKSSPRIVPAIIAETLANH